MKLNYQDHSTHVNFPETIKVHEHKAPTDESIRLMEEMHDKAINNIIAKVKVQDNLISGDCFLITQPYNIGEFKMVFKFKVNGKDFTIEKEISGKEIGWNEQNQISEIEKVLGDYGKSFMLWYTLKMFTAIAYEKIVGSTIPEYLLK